MADFNNDLPVALSQLFSELVDGSARDWAWVLNPEDPGLLRSLDTLTAAAASARAPGGRSSIAAHVDHLRYGLQLLNRWSEGENPFGDADYSASWRKLEVSEPEWAQLRDDLRKEAYRWRKGLEQPRALSEVEFMGVLASVVHLAYHIGAIRQIDPATRGPAARD